MNMTSEKVLVRIPQGTLRGKKEESAFGNEFISFQRIPYAKPPIGDLRFKSPEPAEGWTGIRDATETGTVCPSMDIKTVKCAKNSDEDSLFASIYTKEIPKKLGDLKKPVLLYIHGGGFVLLSGSRDSHGPDIWMLHDVVLVVINYRLGAFGFLSLQTPECPGNYGLKDQRLALRWVKQNIGYFGGDPDNVTIVGESAGGSSVHYHLLTPSTKGLFKRAIAQSGAATNPWAYSSKPRDCAFLLGKRLGCDTTDDAVLLDFLKKAPFRDIIEKSEKILHELQGVNAGENMMNFTFVPTAEPESPDAFMTEHPWTLLNRGKQQDVPLIAGACSNECLMLLLRPNSFPELTSDADFQALLPRDLRLEKNSELSLEIARRVRQFYFKDGVDTDKMIQLLSASSFIYGVYKAIKTRVTDRKFKSPSYMYSFTYKGDLDFMKGSKGTMHGQDLVYQFSPTNLFPLPRVKKESPDYDFILKFTKLWVDFASGKIPTAEKPIVSWPPTEAGRMNYLDIGKKFVIKEKFLKEEMDFWDQIYDLAKLPPMAQSKY